MRLVGNGLICCQYQLLEFIKVTHSPTFIVVFMTSFERISLSPSDLQHWMRGPPKTTHQHYDVTDVSGRMSNFDELSKLY